MDLLVNYTDNIVSNIFEIIQMYIGALRAATGDLIIFTNSELTH